MLFKYVMSIPFLSPAYPTYRNPAFCPLVRLFLLGRHPVLDLNPLADGRNQEPCNPALYNPVFHNPAALLLRIRVWPPHRSFELVWPVRLQAETFSELPDRFSFPEIRDFPIEFFLLLQRDCRLFSSPRAVWPRLPIFVWAYRRLISVVFHLLLQARVFLSCRRAVFSHFRCLPICRLRR